MLLLLYKNSVKRSNITVAITIVFYAIGIWGLIICSHYLHLIYKMNECRTLSKRKLKVSSLIGNVPRNSLDKYSDIVLVVNRLIMRADDLVLRSIHYVLYSTYNNLMILALVKINSCKKCVHSTL